MTKRVIQTSPDIGLTIRLPRRQTVVQQAAPQTVAAAPGAPVWLGWQAQGGAACARLIYPACTPQLGSGGSGWDQEWGTGEAQALETPTLPPWPYPQAWLAGVPPVEKPDDWRICQRITWTARATLKIRTLDLDILRAGEIPHELIEREAQTVWEREIELDVPAAPPAAEPPQGGRAPLGGAASDRGAAAGARVGGTPTWPDGLYQFEIDPQTGGQAGIKPIEPDPLHCCQWTAPPEGLPFAPPADIAPGGRQLLRLTRDDFDLARLCTISGVHVQIEPGATDMERDVVLMANLPAVIPFDRAGTLLVTTAAYNVIGDPGLLFDTDLTCTAHDEDGRALGEVSLHLPVILFEQENQIYM